MFDGPTIDKRAKVRRLRDAGQNRANDVHFNFWFCNHLQPLAATCSGSHLAATLQPLVTQTSKFQHCTLSSLCKKCKISSSLALQKFRIYSRKSLGLFHDFSARSSGKNRNFFAEQHCRNLGFLQNCMRRNHDILRTDVAVTCSHLAATCSHLQVAAKWKIKTRTSCELNENRARKRLSGAHCHHPSLVQS